MISQTQNSSNQYGFYAVPKKLQPKKKYRQTQYQDVYDDQRIQHDNNQNQFQQLQREEIDQRFVEKDFYVDQAPYPEFKPKERGLDYGVQIQKGDLFDYDLEVQPLLEILVGRSVVSAINELQEQKQKKEKKQKLQEYQKKRNAELMVTQRLEAKSKRKKQESQRRVLQKEIYVKNQKQAGKKVIARKNAKKALLGLKNQLFNQLQQSGYLRSQPYTDLRINYEGWLYEQITDMIKQQENIKNQVYKLINSAQDENEDEHKKHIQKQKKRREQIQKERQRIKKENEERRQKKRIKRQRLQLNAKRQQRSIKFDELLEKYHEVESIIMTDVNRSNGWIDRNNNSVNTLHIAGGLGNFLIAYMNSNELGSLDAEQIQQHVLFKLLSQSSGQFSLQFPFSQPHFALIQQALQQLQQNPNAFMLKKRQKIQELKQKVSLSIQWLEMNKINLKSKLVNSLNDALLNIVLGTSNIGAPQQGEQVYEITDKDKQRQQMKKKIELKSTKGQNLEQISQLLRVRFERKCPEEQSKKSQDLLQNEDQWIDIYDGEGWKHHCKQYSQESNKQTQKPCALIVSPFEKSFVYDERTLYFLRKELEKLFEVEAGPELNKYVEEVCNLNTKIKSDIPVYDGEARIQ